MAVAVTMGIVGMLVLSGVEVAVSVAGKCVGDGIAAGVSVGMVVIVGGGVNVFVTVGVGAGRVAVCSASVIATAVLVGSTAVALHPNNPRLSKQDKINHPNKYLVWYVDAVLKYLLCLRRPIARENSGGALWRQAN